MTQTYAPPTVEQVRELEPEIELVIPPEFEDSNGHMNVMHYYGLHEQVTSSACKRFGFPDPDRRYGIFSLEARVRHHSEVLIGDNVQGFHRLLEFDGRRLHGVGFLLVTSAQTDKVKVASSFEYLMATVDLESRRISTLPERFRSAISLELERGSLTWPPPVFDRISLEPQRRN